MKERESAQLISDKQPLRPHGREHNYALKIKVVCQLWPTLADFAATLYRASAYSS